MLSKNGHNQPGYQVIEYNKRIETSSDVSEKFKMQVNIHSGLYSTSHLKKDRALSLVFVP